ncbi:MAG TPA: Asp-tRNA(Asn)/Glu-tRNA(Gln) amidotransferase subunit GatB [Polyangiaceae bacterium]|nr:Asp-tRNA(Asn)/Glu-tRNA(Gln) amidotransferase subunit GatB [Polyangiaceae bacterium]
MTQYEPVIGLEVHAQLLTQSKLFCRCSCEFGHTPNSNVCPTCLGLPGSLPAINETAVRMAVRAGVALDCALSPRSIFARKQYFYPDLPKGYQISQFDQPLYGNGHLDIDVDGVPLRAGITRIHMEEDAGKNLHGMAGSSVVDLNRAGTPLIEIVGEPDLRSSAQAAAYLRALREILVCIGVNDGNLEEGSFRCDANVSVRPKGSEKFGTRVELKNINSFRFVQRAIDSEIARQIALLDAGQKVVQETRSFDPDTGKTRSLRSKEEAHDYRYFPEPDLPPLCIPDAMLNEERALVGELPAQTRGRWVTEYSLTPAAAATLSQHPDCVRFFEAVVGSYRNPVKAANWIQTEVLRSANLHGLHATFSVSASQVAELLQLIDDGKISGKQAKEVFAAIENTQKSPANVVQELGIAVVANEDALIAACQKVIDANPKQVEQFRAGKQALVGYFVGQVMKETRGAADPALVNQVLLRLLGAN